MKTPRLDSKTCRSRRRARASTAATLSAALAGLATLAGAGCVDDPLAPDAATAPAPALEAALLIGQSPLVPVSAPALFTRQAPDGALTRELQAGFEVTPPVAADGGGSVVIRSSAAFYAVIDPKNDPTAAIDPKNDPTAVIDPKTDPVAAIDPKTDPVAAIDPKIDPTALVVIALPIDDASWAAIEKATPEAGDEVEAVVTAELILVAKDGSETILDRVTTTGVVDPKIDPAA